MSDKEVKSLLEKWYKAKQKIIENEKKCEKYKKLANKVLTNKGVNSISAGDYTLKRHDINRSTITKTDVPKEVWDRYSRQISYKSFYLTEKVSR